MPLITLPPSLKDNIVTPFVTWDDLFNEEEFKKISLIAENLTSKEATIQNESEKQIDARESKVKWINANQDTFWLFKKLSVISTLINDDFYRFDLHGMYEAIQHTTYEPNMHYGWHVDSGVQNNYDVVPRKLSITIQLSDPSEYEGGDLEIWTGGKPTAAPRKKGCVVGFPSFRLHRITPVTKGVRNSLVVWVGGPNFK